jgi:CTP synthase
VRWCRWKTSRPSIRCRRCSTSRDSTTSSSSVSLECPPADLASGNVWSTLSSTPSAKCTIAFVGKYLDLLDAYKSLVEAITHAGIHTRTRVVVRIIDAEDLERHGTGRARRRGGDPGARGLRPARLRRQDHAPQYARERRVPYLGICYGLHAAVIDLARHVAGLAGAHSTEIDPAPHTR